MKTFFGVAILVLGVTLLGVPCSIADKNRCVANNPCQNGGICISHTTSSECNCVGGFTGDTCDIPPPLDTITNDPCNSNPCPDGQQCQVSTGIGDRRPICYPPYEEGAKARFLPSSAQPQTLKRIT